MAPAQGIGGELDVTIYPGAALARAAPCVYTELESLLVSLPVLFKALSQGKVC